MKQLPPGTHYLSLHHQDRERRVVVHVPHYGHPPYPVVLAFHGAGGTARIMLHHSKWSLHADLHGFVVVAPQGTPPKPEEKTSFRFNPQLWNLGSPALATMTRDADDVGLARVILDTLPQYVEVNDQRIYSTGFSNGAGLTFRLASEIGDRLAAICPVAGLPSPNLQKTPRPIPTYCLYGSLDPLVPWNGGEVTSPWSTKSSVRPAVLKTIQNWTLHNGFTLQHQLLNQADNYQDHRLGSFDSSAVVDYTVIDGLGHHWPGGKDVGVPVEILGPRIKCFDATERIWQFFSQFTL